MTAQAPTETLEVPGEPGVYWCARHRREKTLLRCGRCERPICSKCTVHSPAGVRCRECSSNKSLHIYRVSPLQFVVTFFFALILGAVGALFFLAAPAILFLVLFYGAFAGTALGKVVAKFTGGKRGLPLALVASAGATVGALMPVWLALLAVAYVAPQGVLLVASAFFTHSYLWVYLVLYLAILLPGLWYWIR